MPLTKEERDFLDAFVYEATHEPFGGPAADALRQRDIYYADLHGLLTSYHRELVVEGTLRFGKHNPTSPPSPWANREEVEQRGRVLMEEVIAGQSAPAIQTSFDGSTATPRQLPSGNR
jgi:hypothetical protein